ncbi:MAG: mechanosensitive ion channel family protein, partial [Methanobacteriota archaeon]
AIVFVVYKILNIIIFRQVKKLVAKEPKLNTIYSFVRKLVGGIILLIGVTVVVFAVFPEARGVTASLFVAAGFVSIVIGLAAQSTLSNLMSGMLIAFSQPFRLGDAVVFKGDFGFIEDIKLMHTVIRTWDNRRLVVPNGLFQSEVVLNYTAKDSTMLAPVFVQVSYESDLEKAMKIMVDVAKRHPECMPIGDLPNAVVMEFADSGINLRLLSRAKDQPTAFMMVRDLLFQIKKEFDANGIEIPYPRRYLVVGKELESLLSGMKKPIEKPTEMSRKEDKQV